MSLSVHLLIFNLLQSNFVREADGHLVSPFLMNSWSKPILVLTLKFQLHLVCYLSNSKKSFSSLLRNKQLVPLKDIYYAMVAGRASCKAFNSKTYYWLNSYSALILMLVLKF